MQSLLERLCESCSAPPGFQAVQPLAAEVLQGLLVLCPAQGPERLTPAIMVRHGRCFAAPPKKTRHELLSLLVKSRSRLLQAQLPSVPSG